MGRFIEGKEGKGREGAGFPVGRFGYERNAEC